MIKNSSSGVWVRVAAVAGKQLGLVTLRQLRELGIPDSTIVMAAENGRLHRVFHSVYSVGHRYLTAHGRLLAATMACGPGSVVSHGTAAWLLHLQDARPGAIEVIAPVEAGRRIAGIRRRFVPPPSPSETWVRGRVPTTNAARTVVDLAGIYRPSELGGVIEQAAVVGVLDVAGIDAILDGPRRRGARRLLRALEPWRRYSAGIQIRSRMEAKLLPLLTEAGLPVPRTNARLRIDGEIFEVDFLWQRQRLVIETDGRRFHDNPAAGSRDSRRNRALTAAGYRVPRLGWEDLRDRPDAALSEIRRLLDRT